MKESLEQKIAFYLCSSETDAPKSPEMGYINERAIAN